jgi:hypothetical protein
LLVDGLHWDFVDSHTLFHKSENYANSFLTLFDKVLLCLHFRLLLKVKLSVWSYQERLVKWENIKLVYIHKQELRSQNLPCV